MCWVSIVLPWRSFWEIFSNRDIAIFTESRPSEKVTESSSTYYKSERTTSKFSVQMSLFGSKKITRGRHEKKITCKYKEGGFGRGMEGGKKLKCRAFNAHGSQSESVNVPWDLLQVWLCDSENTSLPPTFRSFRREIRQLNESTVTGSWNREFSRRFVSRR